MYCLAAAAAAAAKSLQSCLTLFDPIDGSPPGFPIPGILQARTLEWVAISFSTSLKKTCGVSVILIMYTFCCCAQWLSYVSFFATPWNAACQAYLSFNIFWSLLKFMSTESVMPSNHLIFCFLLLLLPSIFPTYFSKCKYTY